MTALPPRCSCRPGGGPGGPEGGLCSVMARLKNRAAAEYELAAHTGDWRFYHDVMCQAGQHLAAATLAIR